MTHQWEIKNQYIHGDQNIAEDMHFHEESYHSYRFGAGGRECPDEECGALLKKTTLVWAENSLGGRAHNNLGRQACPPRLKPLREAPVVPYLGERPEPYELSGEDKLRMAGMAIGCLAFAATCGFYLQVAWVAAVAAVAWPLYYRSQKVSARSREISIYDMTVISYQNDAAQYSREVEEQERKQTAYRRRQSKWKASWHCTSCGRKWYDDRDLKG